MRPLGSLVRLDLETRDEHAVADEPWLSLCEDARTPCEQDYMRVLVRTYGFEAPLEAALAYTPHFEALVDMTGRYRSGLIAQDLLVLGLGAGQVASVAQCMIAPFASVAEALGWLYVHERATLCHERVRATLLARAPGLKAATAYLTASAGTATRRFEDLGAAIARIARTSLIEDRVVSGARAAFRTQRGWTGAPQAFRVA
jgi:heme oxygenase